jgi:hypothetical protein
MRRIAYALMALGAGCARTHEYRLSGDRFILYPGAHIVSRGVLVGEVARIQHRGETTYVLLEFDDPGNAPRYGDLLRTRFLGARHESAMEIVRTVETAQHVPSQGWIHLGPPVLFLPPPRAQAQEIARPVNPFRFIPLGPPRHPVALIPVSQSSSH